MVQLCKFIAIFKKGELEEKIKLLTDYLKKYNGIKVLPKMLN